MARNPNTIYYKKFVKAKHVKIDNMITLSNKEDGIITAVRTKEENPHFRPYAIIEFHVYREQQAWQFYMFLNEDDYIEISCAIN